MLFSKGVVKLAVDMKLPHEIGYAVDMRNRRAVLDCIPNGTPKANRLRVYRSGPRSKSRYINFTKLLRSMGIDWKQLSGNEYEVKISGTKLEIQL